jgi:GxxExxY protein
MDGVLISADETFRIRGALIEVSNVIGHGFLEAVYQECVALELTARGIPFRAMPELQLTYKGAQLRQTFIPDFVCCESIILELKAVRQLDAAHRAQVFNYLKATGLRVGLLANFGQAGRIEIERVVL